VYKRQPLTFAIGDARCFALVRVIADEAELLTIATHPAHQRQGLARQVMQDWQDLARTRSATEAFLEVAADNTAAQALYQACGFATCGTRPGYYARKGAAPVDAVLMRCSLR
jgi:ribosomal-protein-alanine N-acetyltransferase